MKRKSGTTREKVRLRIRAKVSGTDKRPRLSVFRSSMEMFAQIIDDEKGVTLAGLSSRKVSGGTKKEQAYNLGAALAKLAKDRGISQVVFDRGGYIYHGRVEELARGARSGGLEF